MRLWIVLVVTLWTPLSALSQTPSQPLPLTEPEKRQILRQLIELEAAREQIRAYSDYVDRDRQADERERANWQRAVELEKQAAAIAVRERDLAEERAKFYEAAYRALAKKPGFGCWMKRIFSLGIARCR